MNTKRIILYVHYDPDNIIDEHIHYQIKCLYNYGCKIIFISNSYIYNKDIIKDYVDEIIIRKNIGFDFYAWKEVIFSKERASWLKWDELILMNSTCYGPIFPLDKLFQTMNLKKCDFWGITEYYTDNTYDDHLQSYFICFKKTLFHKHCL